MEYRKTVRLRDGRECLLRSGTEQDAGAALDCFVRTHGQTDYLTTYPEETRLTVGQEAEFLRSKAESAGDVELLALVGGEVVGMAGVEGLGTKEKIRHRAQFGISIDRDFWSLGIGRALTSACIECARRAGYAQLELEAVAENERAIALYQSVGFMEYGRNPRGFRSRLSGWQPLVLMRLELDGEERKEHPMDREKLVIRRETERDHRAVEHLIRESFWNVYRPGCLEHYVIHRLRDDPAFVPELDLVMEKDGVLIGQNMFMRAVIHADDGREIPIMTMGPICIDRALQRQGYGKYLLERSLALAAEMGCGALCFEGNIRFYGTCGFTYASEFGIRYHGLPEGADASFFLCRELQKGYLDGVRGEYGPPEGYYCAEREPEAFERFEAQFPPKQKLKLPGQLV